MLFSVILTLNIVIIAAPASSFTYLDYQDETSVVDEDESYGVTWLHSGETYKNKNENVEELRIFCHCGGRQTVLSIWRSVYLEIRNCRDYTLFEGNNATDVAEQYKSHVSSWLPMLPWRQSVVTLPAFSNYCIGITSSQRYELHLAVRRINYWKVIQLLGGIALFFVAPSLSRNVLFYYASGTSIGVLASLLILVFLLSRLVPKKVGAYSIIVLGWSMVLYVLQLMWSNMRDIVQKYQSFLIGYVAISALVSFAVCYRYGPTTNVRTQNLIQWSFQLIGLGLVFGSSELHEISMALVIAIVTAYNIPSKWIAKARTWWHLRFPPRVKLLSEEDFIQQSAIETEKALRELRQFCNSPDCNAWKTMCRLKDPIRFAKFVEGESHLKDEEILDYESEPVTPISCLDFTDDESDEEIEALNSQIQSWTTPRSN